MIDGPKISENYYNGDDWRLFNPDNFNDVLNLDIKAANNYNNYLIYTYTSSEDSDIQDQDQN